MHTSKVRSEISRSDSTRLFIRSGRLLRGRRLRRDRPDPETREARTRLADSDHCPFGAAGGWAFLLMVGSALTSQPPPSALISSTLALMRRPAISTAVTSSASAALCAVVTSRYEVTPPL